MNPASEWEPERRGNQVIATFINVIYHEGKGQQWWLTSYHTLTVSSDWPAKPSRGDICLYELWGSIMGDKAEIPPIKATLSYYINQHSKWTSSHTVCFLVHALQRVICQSHLSGTDAINNIHIQDLQVSKTILQCHKWELDGWAGVSCNLY